MGGCWSLIQSCLEGEVDGGSTTNETELQQQKAKNAKTLAIARSMSAPSIEVHNRTKVRLGMFLDKRLQESPSHPGHSSSSCSPQVSGYGLALCGVAIEQDAAYWEAHIDIEGSEEKKEVMLGVATRKDRKFFTEQEQDGGGKGSRPNDVLTKRRARMVCVERRKLTLIVSSSRSLESSTPGTDFMRTISVSNEDTVGIAVQQSDLPMVQFFQNGEPLHDLAINRFRGTVYPSIYLSAATSEGLSVGMVFNESDFQEMAPNVRFGPVIVARGII